jgi:cytochrome P450
MASRELPPGPRMPSALQAVGWALRPLPFMKRCSERYGDLFTLRIRGGRPWVIVSDPEDVGKVLTISPELVRAGAGEANPLLGPLLGPRSVMLLDEPEHLTHRKFILSSFHGERMRGYGEMMVEVAREEIARWPIGEPFALWPRMQAISMEVVMRSVFGATDTPQMAELRTLLKRLTDWLNDPSRLTLLSAFGSRWLSGNSGFRAVIEPVEASVLEEVRRRHALPGRPHDDGILSLLEQAYDENGTPMTQQELRDELITLLSDGPTATSLAWAFERLLRHPDKFARLRTEILDGEEESYTDAVVKETLRLAPAVPLVMRKLVAPMRLGGYTLPANTIVAPSIYLVHHREDIYPRPFAFMPERFLDRPAGTYSWIPFGSGVRRCVAAVFAQLEMKRVIQTVVREVDLGAAPQSSGAQRATRSSVAFAPGQALAQITRRRHPGLASLPSLNGGPRPAAPSPVG